MESIFETVCGDFPRLVLIVNFELVLFVVVVSVFVVVAAAVVDTNVADEMNYGN